MKSKFKLTLALLVFSTMLAHATRGDLTKQYRKAWPKSTVTAMKITNKFGEVKINDTGGDSVTVNVLIKIDNQSDKKAAELLSKIQIDIKKTGGLVTGETTIEENFNIHGTFSIDYLINIPKDRDLDIMNRYGNVVVNELEAKGNFDVSYGNLTAGKLVAPTGNKITITVSYGKADIELINDADMEFKYSKLYVGEIGQLVLDSKYSTVNLQKSANLTLDSKYDAVNIDAVGNLKSVSKYTNYKIGLLTGSFDLDTGYGSVQISKVDQKFDKIRIINSYGGINIGLNKLNYKLQADCEYCEVNYPEDRYKGNKIKDNQHFSLEGNVGTGGGSVSITSRYGAVKLTE